MFFKRKVAAHIVHAEFNAAGEKLLSEAKKIVSGIKLSGEERIKLQRVFGFTQTDEVNKQSILEKVKSQNEALATVLEYLSIHYPRYKFITRAMTLQICEKYNLYLGQSFQYLGDIPTRNLKQIEEFFKTENEINVRYETGTGGWMWDWQRDLEIFSKDEYDRRKPDGVSKSKTLYICAPIKDMDTRGYKLRGRTLVKDDPVVLFPIKIKNVLLDVIVTAWGPEASDEIVVNQINN